MNEVSLYVRGNIMAESHEIEVYVRFCETDAAGHVNNTSYFFYLEEARTKFFKVLGFDRDTRESSLDFILASTSCDYLSQAYGAQMLKISTYVSNVGTKSFSLNHIITDVETEKVIAKGSAVTVCFNYEEQKTEIIPDVLRETLEGYLIGS